MNEAATDGNSEMNDHHMMLGGRGSWVWFCHRLTELALVTKLPCFWSLDAPSFVTEPSEFASTGVAKLARHNIAGQ